jgi:hypothetical protein
VSKAIVAKFLPSDSISRDNLIFFSSNTSKNDIIMLSHFIAMASDELMSGR